MGFKIYDNYPGSTGLVMADGALGISFLIN